ncbi:nucleotidyltransferase domain-containing protein [Candidatus Pacearchaeota archaeon]|nr:nucleotidyltransferase domain-containing protein [Candidatus Pacearchaeota archaeon]
MRREILTKIESVNEIAEEIGKDENVVAVYLFGSYASGKQHPLSDIDLCVIIKDRNKEYETTLPASDNLDVSFFHRLPITIKYRVFTEGKALLIKDRNFVDDLRIDTVNEYIDFKPHLNKFLFERFKCTI